MALNDQERAKVEKEARALLDGFSKTLSKIKLKENKVKEELSGFRAEGSGEKCDSYFRERMFANASEKEGDFIIAERKSW